MATSIENSAVLRRERTFIALTNKGDCDADSVRDEKILYKFVINITITTHTHKRSKDKIVHHDDETFVINVAVMQEKKIYKEAHSQQ